MKTEARNLHCICRGFRLIFGRAGTRLAPTSGPYFYGKAEMRKKYFKCL